MSTNEHNEQSELQKKLESVTPEKLRKIGAGRLLALVAAVGHLAELLQEDKTAEPLQDVEKRKATPLLPLTILTSSQLDAKGRKLHGVALGDSPALDPSSPDFDRQAYKAALQELAPQITETAELLRQYQNDTMQVMLDSLTDALIKGIPTALLESLPTGEILKVATSAQETFTSRLTAELGEDETRELLPYIMQAMNDPKYNPDDWDESEEREAELWQQLIQEARQLRAAEAEGLTTDALLILDGGRIKDTEWPMSKINRELWPKTKGHIEGQYSLLFSTLQDDTTPSIVAINADALPPEMRELPEYDRRVWTAAISLWVAGCRRVSVDDIYYAMGNNSNINPRDKKKIDTAMYKMSLMKARIDNTEEAERSNYALYWGGEFYILPNEKIWAINPANGKKVEAYLLPTDKPRLLHYAESRGQVRKIRREVLCTPNSQTDNGLKLDDYLIDRLIDMRDGRADSNKILYSSIFDLLKTRSDHRPGVIDKVHAILDYFKQIRFIADWQEAGKNENPGVYILIAGRRYELPKK